MEEVEVLMERMKLLQEYQLEEEGVTQEEMETHFEMEKRESLLVTPSGKQGIGWGKAVLQAEHFLEVWKGLGENMEYSTSFIDDGRPVVFSDFGPLDFTPSSEVPASMGRGQ